MRYYRLPFVHFNSRGFLSTLCAHIDPRALISSPKILRERAYSLVVRAFTYYRRLSQALR